MTQLRVTDRENLSVVNDRIHDRWFNVDDVALDAARSILRVPFSESRKRSARSGAQLSAEHYLEIANVRNFALLETEGVGRYDFNDIQFSEVKHMLVVRTGIPLTFEIAVSDIDIRIGNVDH